MSYILLSQINIMRTTHLFRLKFFTLITTITEGGAIMLRSKNSLKYRYLISWPYTIRLIGATCITMPERYIGQSYKIYHSLQF